MTDIQHDEGNVEALMFEAYERGKTRGEAERAAGIEEREGVLSGEWAGESTNELLGDIVAKLEVETDLRGELISEISQAYEDGYADGHHPLDLEEESA